MIIRQFLILCHIIGLVIIVLMIADGVVDEAESLLERVLNGTLPGYLQVVYRKSIANKLCL